MSTTNLYFVSQFHYWEGRGLKKHLSANIKWLQEMCAWHSTPCRVVKPMLISNCLSKHPPNYIRFPSARPSAMLKLKHEAKTSACSASVAQVMEKEREREREQSLSHLHWICIVTIASINPYKYPLPAISCIILLTGLNLNGNGW